MTVNVQFKNLNEARKEFNNWKGNAAIFIDMGTLEVWTEVNEVGTYDNSDNVIGLVGKSDLNDRNKKYNLNVLEKLAEAKYNDYKEGYSKWQIEGDYRYSGILWDN